MAFCSLPYVFLGDAAMQSGAYHLPTGLFMARRWVAPFWCWRCCASWIDGAVSSLAVVDDFGALVPVVEWVGE